MSYSSWLLRSIKSNPLVHGLHEFDRRLEGVVALASSAEARELYRLGRLPLLQPAMTSLLGRPLRLVDGQSFVAQYRIIFREELYRFRTTRPDPLILDGGANIGVATIYWKRLYPQARITAFEADPHVFATLSWNCRQFGLANVELVKSALWSKDGQLPFWSQGIDSGRLQEIPPGIATIEVRTASLRPYLEEPVDFLKLDIEGAEVDVLLDCQDDLSRVQNIFVEYHSFGTRPQRLGEILAILESAGFRVHILPEVVCAQPFLSRLDNKGFDLQLNIFASRPS